MKNQICNAIQNPKILEFYYENYYRTVEPHSLGVSTAGKEVLSAYQVSGQSGSTIPAWKLFDLNKITSLTESGNVFGGSEPGYQRNSSKMASIKC